MRASAQRGDDVVHGRDKQQWAVGSGAREAEEKGQQLPGRFMASNLTLFLPLITFS